MQHNGSVTEDQILKASADAVADKMSKELNDVVGVGIDEPFGGLVSFGKRGRSRMRSQWGPAEIG